MASVTSMTAPSGTMSKTAETVPGARCTPSATSSTTASPRARGRSRGQGDVVADGAELVDCSVPGLVGVEAGEVVGSGVAVALVLDEHVPGRDDDRVLDGDDGLERSFSGRDA